ncbi:N-methyl-D-aspartate receptor NMDAR2C subunit [bacterium]|nr:N-methyl-D-aspartate receptor NMDAR2C subunit [bacterium]
MTAQASARRERLRQRWEKLLPHLSAQPVLDAYDHPSRGYHNLEHLEEVLNWTDEVPVNEAERDRLRLALFYHDAIYDSHRSDNEQASADWATSDLGEAAGPLVDLILDTRHSAQPSSELGGWMVDIDLAVLGADPARFERYNAGVRHEYAWVPNWLYRRKRRQILGQFLKRPQIYHSEYFRERLESAARENLQRATAAL